MRNVFDEMVFEQYKFLPELNDKFGKRTNVVLDICHNYIDTHFLSIVFEKFSLGLTNATFQMKSCIWQKELRKK